MHTRFTQRARTVAGVLLLVLPGWMAPAARANPTPISISYQTFGQMASLAPGVPDPLVSFQEVSSGTFTGSGNFLLGDFVVTQPTGFASLTYNNEPVDIKVIDSRGETLDVSMTLNGTLGASSTAQIVVNRIAAFVGVLPSTSFGGIPVDQIRVGGPIALDPSFNHGVIPVFGQVAAVPEPSSAAIALVAIAGVGVLRWRRLAA